MRHILLIALAITVTMLEAKVITVTTKGAYEMQRGDSKEDARSYALMYAKMNAVEEAGTVVRSVFEKKVNSKGARFAKHDLKSYSAAMIKSTIKKVAYKGNTCTVTILAKLDTKDVDEYLKADSDVKAQITQLVESQKRLTKELDNLKKSKKRQNDIYIGKKLIAQEYDINELKIKSTREKLNLNEMISLNEKYAKIYIYEEMDIDKGEFITLTSGYANCDLKVEVFGGHLKLGSLCKKGDKAYSARDRLKRLLEEAKYLVNFSSKEEEERFNQWRYSNKINERYRNLENKFAKQFKSPYRSGGCNNFTKRCKFHITSYVYDIFLDDQKVCTVLREGESCKIPSWAKGNETVSFTIRANPLREKFIKYMLEDPNRLLNTAP